MNTAVRSAQVGNPRKVERLVVGKPTSDGAGVRLTRMLTQDLQRRLDPFLMLDAFGSDDPDDYIAGFPDHPHRGFETVTYMIAGRMRHRDSAGHEGLLEDGGVQWMTAGRGEVSIAGTAVPAQRMAILANDAAADGVVIRAAGEARALLIAGRPLNEPIAQYGPFVMNTEQEIGQALQDFREGRLLG